MGFDEALGKLHLAHSLLGGAVISLRTVSMFSHMQSHNPGCFNRARESVLEAQLLIQAVRSMIEVNVPEYRVPDQRPEGQLFRWNGEAISDFFEARSRIKDLYSVRQTLEMILNEHGVEISEELPRGLTREQGFMVTLIVIIIVGVFLSQFLFKF